MHISGSNQALSMLPRHSVCKATESPSQAKREEREIYGCAQPHIGLYMHLEEVATDSDKYAWEG
eukprot:scaffold30029_cov19-Prasinocladus_malaysianus.AAC.1